MIWPSMRVFKATVLKASTEPSPVRYTGKSRCWTVATPTGTAGGGPLALAFLSARLQPARAAHISSASPTLWIRRNVKPSSSLASGIVVGVDRRQRHETRSKPLQLQYYE